MIGTELALGVTNSPLQSLVQGSGTALRIDALAFGEIFDGAPELRRLIYRYVHVVMTQLALTTVCNSFHSLAARLARWLLLSHDRSQNGSFRLTHKFLAQMLGVRRVGVTNAAGDLRRQNLIHYERGEISVLNPTGLQDVSCTCYQSAIRVYQTILGTDHQREANVRL